jgi:hypothetical protein
VLPPTDVVGAFVVEAGEMKIRLETDVVGELEGLQLLVTVRAHGVLRCSQKYLGEKRPQAPKRLGPE